MVYLELGLTQLFVLAVLVLFTPMSLRGPLNSICLMMRISVGIVELHVDSGLLKPQWAPQK